MSWHYPSYPSVATGDGALIPSLNVQWRKGGGLYANLWGAAEPRDRIYLRRVNKSRGRVRWVHPPNPSGPRGGNLPRHVENLSYARGPAWHGGHAGHPGNFTGGNVNTTIRTEWLAEQADLYPVQLLDYATLRSLFGTASPGSRPVMRSHRHGRASHGFLLNFVVARPYVRAPLGTEWVQFGPPSQVFYVKFEIHPSQMIVARAI